MFAVPGEAGEAGALQLFLLLPMHWPDRRVTCFSGSASSASARGFSVPDKGAVVLAVVRPQQKVVDSSFPEK